MHWIGAFRSTLRRRFPSGRRLRRRGSILARYGPGPQRSFLLSWHCDSRSAAVCPVGSRAGSLSFPFGFVFVPFRFSAVCVGTAADRGAVPRVLWHDWRYVWPVHRRGCTAACAATASHIGPQGRCPWRPWSLRYAPKHTRVSDTPHLLTPANWRAAYRQARANVPRSSLCAGVLVVGRHQGGTRLDQQQPRYAAHSCARWRRIYEPQPPADCPLTPSECS